MIKATKSEFFQPLRLFLVLLLLCCLIACGGSADTADTGGDTTVTAASLDLIASPPTVKSDGSTTSTITITAKNSSNATLSGVVITMSADTGNVGPTSVTTGTDGTATATFSSGGGTEGPINRTATITATSGSVSSMVQVEVVDSTVTLSSTGTSITTAGTETLTITAKNAGGYGINGASVILGYTSTDSGSVTFGSSTGTTSTVDSVAGVFKTTVTGSTAGTVTIIARALGASASTDLTVATAAQTFAIDKQWLDTVYIGNPNPSAMQIGQDLEIQVNVPSAVSNVTFSTTQGSWVGGSGTWIQVPAAGVSPDRKASATLNTANTGTANVMIYDTSNTLTNDTMTVYMSSSAAPHRIMLQASPTVVPINTGEATITATVRDSSDLFVADKPVSFSIVNPTGGGETILTAVVKTATNGQASTTFKAGSLTSYDAGGVKIHAEVIGTAAPMVETGVSPSGNDASVVIGGKPGSIAFGRATVLTEAGGGADYVQAMSVLVTDINGNAVSGATVSLNAWPIAWSTGVLASCAYDPDYYSTYEQVDDDSNPGTPSEDDDGVIGTDTPVEIRHFYGDRGTFLNEDVNENLILDNYGNPYYLDGPAYANPPYDDDGLRRYYASSDYASGTGNPDTYITPTNSAGGSVPATVITGADGVATFNLTYPKQSAIWTVTRIRASTIVQGSETVGQTIFRLPCTETDCGSTCRLSCPYTF